MNKSDATLDRDQFVLAAMAAAEGAGHQPVQIQKLIFLLDDKIGTKVGGPFFHFEPYDYGPFDGEVYRTIEELEIAGKAEIVRGGWARRVYRLTEKGQAEGIKLLEQLDHPTTEYIKTLSSWVRSLSFSQLVSAVYKAYPEMKVNSVFVDC
jgi:uncharacterized protein YwgA